jgi:GH24 family phage-related lysozyme (muramidase)
MKLSRRGVRLIQDYEGFRSSPYRDSVGVWTIGYGSTKGVGPQTAPLNRQQASERLRSEVDAEYGAAVNALHLPLNQHQFDALVSFVYNVGPGALGLDTGIGRELRAHHWHRAADELLRWDKAGGRALPGLTRRRRAERQLFLTPPP